MQKGINTILKLNQDYIVIQDTKAYTIKAPDGFEIEHRMTLSSNMKILFSHAGIVFTETETTRQTDVRVFEIDGIEVKKESNDRLLIHSENFKEAARKLDKVRKKLNEDGYIIESRECKIVGDCEDTIKRLTEF